MKKRMALTSLCLGLLLTGAHSADTTDAPQKEAVKNESDANLKAMLLGNKDYHPQTWMEKGRVLYLEGQYAEAVQAFFKSTRVHPKNASVWFNLGLSYYKNTQYDEALISFIEANILNKSEKYLFHACLSYFKVGEIRHTISTTRELLADYPNNGQAWKILAQSYEHLEQFEEAKSAYQKAHTLLPEDGEVIHALDKLAKTKEGQLHLPQNSQGTTTIESITSAEFSGQLPMSKILSENVVEAETPIYHGLIPLTESYHLNFDAPSKSRFKPSEEMQWEPKKKSSAPKAKATSIIPKTTFEDL